MVWLQAVWLGATIASETSATNFTAQTLLNPHSNLLRCNSIMSLLKYFCWKLDLHAGSDHPPIPLKNDRIVEKARPLEYYVSI